MYKRTIKAKPEDIFEAVIPPVNSKCVLLNELSDKLDFPSYFGQNWDALYDLFTDFFWIQQKEIRIYHQGLRGLPESDLQVYMDIIGATKRWWAKYNEHTVKFYLNE
ncbi:MAG: barstar family protein [Prevotella sp.]|nr:barstar family protein [Prevotella sp.]